MSKAPDATTGRKSARHRQRARQEANDSFSKPGCEIQPGDVAMIKGLTNNPTFNGKFVKAMLFDEKAQEWTCLVDPDVDGGVFRRVRLKLANVGEVPTEKLAAAKKWASAVRAGGRQTKRTPKTSRATTSRPRSSRFRPLSGLKPPTARGAAASPEEERQHREQVRTRLMQPIKGRPPRAKAARTQSSKDAAASVKHLKDPFDDRDTMNVPIDERAPFFVQTGRRRTHMSQGHREALHGQGKKAGWTEDERIIAPKSFRGSPKPMWDFQRYPCESCASNQQSLGQSHLWTGGASNPEA